VPSSINFRELKAIVAHPRDADGEVLIRCLRRLGSEVEHVWPPRESIGQHVQLLICRMDLACRPLLETATATGNAAVIGIVDPQAADSSQLVAEVTPHAVIVRPFDAAAIVPQIILARNNARFQQRQQSKISKLEETLRSYRKVEQAKAILMQQREIDEPQAYDYLRKQAMRRRVAVGVVATAVVEMNEALSDKEK
jgi:AmiR/NasT family two-component response regulator